MPCVSHASKAMAEVEPKKQESKLSKISKLNGCNLEATYLPGRSRHASTGASWPSAWAKENRETVGNLFGHFAALSSGQRLAMMCLILLNVIAFAWGFFLHIGHPAAVCGFPPPLLRSIWRRTWLRGKLRLPPGQGCGLCVRGSRGKGEWAPRVTITVRLDLDLALLLLPTLKSLQTAGTLRGSVQSDCSLFQALRGKGGRAREPLAQSHRHKPLLCVFQFGLAAEQNKRLRDTRLELKVGADEPIKRSSMFVATRPSRAPGLQRAGRTEDERGRDCRCGKGAAAS